MASFEIKDGVAIIPEGTNKIPSRAFEDCSSLISVVIPESVKSIGVHAFFRCTLMTSVFIPKSVTRIAEAAFAACTSLKSIVVEEGNPIYDSRDNCNAIIETATNTLIQGCCSLTEVTIPDSVQSIGNGAFSGCYSLTSVVISESVKSIGGSAFRYCISLTSISFQGTIAQRKEIELGDNWNKEILAKVVHCTDGDVEI